MYMCVYTYIYTNIYICVCVCAYICINIFIYIYIYIYIYLIYVKTHSVTCVVDYKSQVIFNKTVFVQWTSFVTFALEVGIQTKRPFLRTLKARLSLTLTASTAGVVYVAAFDY